ncbi:MAG: divergent polysaccharide deacetylase family protein [Elusimicrobia bacterium]|nr:divergent polysaccharide deacetylase family protein [Elusimicrobiota bacterium]
MKKLWRLLILVIICIIIIFYFRSRPEDLSTLSNQIDIKINKILTDSGVTNEEVVRNLRIEKESKVAKWIEVNKDIKTDTKKIADIVVKVKVGLEEYYGVNTDFDGKNNLLLILKNGIILNKILFLPAKPVKLKAAILIDDIGYKKDELESFLKLNIPLTYSILPYERYSAYLVSELKKNNQEYFLHQPMEPERYPTVNPGKAAILLNMSAKEIENMVLRNLKNVEGVTGVNNHMGSAFTQDKSKITEFLNVIKQKNLIFVDSSTSNKSVAYKVAVNMNIISRRNEVFLDNEDNLEYILKQLYLLKKKVEKNDGCVAIGHIHTKNLPLALYKVIPEFKKAGISFLTVSEYVKNEGTVK